MLPWHDAENPVPNKEPLGVKPARRSDRAIGQAVTVDDCDLAALSVDDVRSLGSCPERLAGLGSREWVPLHHEP